MSKLIGTRVTQTGVIVWMHGPGLHADQGRRGHTAPCAHTPTPAFWSAELDESQGMVRGTEAAHAPGPHAWERRHVRGGVRGGEALQPGAGLGAAFPPPLPQAYVASGRGRDSPDVVASGGPASAGHPGGGG